MASRGPLVVGSSLTFHEDVHGVAENPDGGQQDQDGEDEGADGVDDDEVRVEVDDQSRDEDAQALDEVADDVDEGGPDVDVLALLRLLGHRARRILGVDGIRTGAFVAVAWTLLVTVAVAGTGIVGVAVTSSATSVGVPVLMQATAHAKQRKRP